MRTVEAIIDEQGNVSLAEPVRLGTVRRALVTILEEEPMLHVPTHSIVNEEALLSEQALADWNSPEEDKAWKHLEDLPALDGEK